MHPAAHGPARAGGGAGGRGAAGGAAASCRGTCTFKGCISPAPRAAAAATTAAGGAAASCRGDSIPYHYSVCRSFMTVS